MYCDSYNGAMWQRFTEMARKAVFYAQEEAEKYGEGYVSTEHLLLGLLREEENVACRVLDQLGVSREALRAEIEMALPRGDLRPCQDMTLTPRAKRVIDLAYDEARGIGNNYIGTEHLLLGLVREVSGLAGRVLAKLGVELDTFRDQVVEEQNAESTGRPAGNISLDPDVRARAESMGRLRKMLSNVPEGSRDHIFSRLLTIRKRIGQAEMLALIALAEPEAPMEELLLARGLEPLIILGAIEGEILRQLGSPEAEAPSVATTLQTAQGLAEGKPLNSAHIVLALIEQGDNAVSRVFRSIGITAQDIRSVI